MPSGTLTGTSFTYVHFWVNGLSGGQAQRVNFFFNSAVIGSSPLIASYTGGAMPSTWTEVKIPIGDFGLSAGQQIDGLVFQSNTGSATLQNLLCYAAITLECGAGPTAAPATPPPPGAYAGTQNSPNGPYSVSGNRVLDKVRSATTLASRGVSCVCVCVCLRVR